MRTLNGKQKDNIYHLCWKHSICITWKRFEQRGKVQLRSDYMQSMVAWILLPLAGVCLRELKLPVLCCWRRYCHCLINRPWECFSLKNKKNMNILDTVFHFAWLFEFWIKLRVCTCTHTQCNFNLTCKLNEACLCVSSVSWLDKTYCAACYKWLKYQFSSPPQCTQSPSSLSVSGFLRVFFYTLYFQ